jgi:triacylglycerol lipase
MNRFLKLLAAATLACSALAAPAQAASDYAKTRYPLVLVHGMAGFDSILGIDYFYQVPADLRRNGATVLVASLSSFNDNDVRGEQLLKQLKEWAAAQGYRKFNLVAHSQGGPTARYVAGVAPELVASVTTVGSPHDLPASASGDAMGAILTGYPQLVTLLGRTLGWASGSAGLPQDPAALQAWAADTSAFNARFPLGRPTAACGQGPEQAGGIYFYSVTGSKPATNILDVSDLVLGAIGKSVEAASDGLVPVCSTHWGKVLRDDYPWNHLDEINQVFGLIGPGAPDPLAFYRQQANRLKLKGL